MLLMFGSQYIEQSYLYHVKKPSSSRSYGLFFEMMVNNWLIVLGSVLYFITQKKKLTAVILVSLFYLLFLLV